MGDLLGVLAFVFLVFTAGVGLVCAISAWFDYGITEHNFLRTLLKSLRGFVWPITIAYWARRYFRERFHGELAEVMRVEDKEKRAAVKHKEAEYSTGQWR